MTIAHLDDRCVVRIAGPDARGFLQGLVTNDVAVMAPDRPVYAGLLSAQGKALFDMILFDGGGEDDGAVLVDVAAGRGEALARRLAMYRLRKAVTIAAVPLRVFAGWGEAAGAGAIGAGVADPRFAGLGRRWIAAAGAADSDADAYDAHRLEVGVPGSADIGSDELLWLETGADLLGGVSFGKGCYIGQENTARMHHRDKVRRRLVPVGLAGEPAVGDAILDAGGRTVGSLRSHRGTAGIAHLRLEAAAGPLTLGGEPLVVRTPAWLEPALAAAVGPA